MKVLKFGGSSVSNAENIRRVISIVRQSVSDEKVIVVVSALGGITDLLIRCATLAARNDEQYKVILQDIEERHLETAKQLIPVANQSSTLSWVKSRCNELEDVC